MSSRQLTTYSMAILQCLSLCTCLFVYPKVTVRLQVMKQASSSSASAQVAHVLFQSARDCLELFMAIVPMQFADAIDTPRMGAVFYNDCLYIAHNCTLLTHKYRHEMGKIDEVLLHTVGFMDFIPRFRQLGDGVLARHLEAQRVALVDLVRNIQLSPDGDSASASAGRYIMFLRVCVGIDLCVVFTLLFLRVNIVARSQLLRPCPPPRTGLRC